MYPIVLQIGYIGPTVKRGIPEFRTEFRMRFFLNEKDFTTIIIHFKPKYLFIT